MNFFETTSETESTTDGIFSYTVRQSALCYAAWGRRSQKRQHNSKNKTRKLRFQNPSEDNFIVRFEY